MLMSHGFRRHIYFRFTFRLHMFENSRTKKLAILGVMAVILGLGAMSPVFAWHDSNFSTQLNPSSCGTGTGCSVASVTDTATITLSDNGPNYGAMTFDVYPAAATGCAAAAGTASLFHSVVSVVGHTDSGSDQTYQTTSAAFSTTGHVGNFVWIVSYGGGGYPSQGPTCEQMKLLTFPPPSTVPQFPLGMALLLAVAIPGLLLVRSKYTGKHSSFLSVR